MPSRSSVAITLMRQEQVTSVVEVGVLHGALTTHLLRDVPSITRYWMVDPWAVYTGSGSGHLWRRPQPWWDAVYDTVVATFANDPRVTILRMPSVEASAVVPDGVDCVYLDGDHSAESVRSDIRAWVTKITQDGVLIGDDYQYPEVQRVVEEMLPNAVAVNRNRQWVYRPCASR